MDFKKELEKSILSSLKIKVILEIPPQLEMGHFALPTFTLKKKPKEIQKTLKLPEFIEKTEIKGNYLNFYLKKTKKQGKKILIEFPGPNTNKPLHLGHVRNICIGQALLNLLNYTGNKTTQVDILNDRGIHICKTMLAYKKLTKIKKPNKKSDHYLGDLYVLFSKQAIKTPDLEKEAQELLKKCEEGDKKTILLWKKLRKWSIEGLNETFDKFKLKIDKVYPESEIYKKGAEIVKKAQKKGIFKKGNDGHIYVELEEFNLPNKTLLRSDGTSIYITQDIYLAQKKYEDYKIDESIILTGSEQILHFKQLTKILELVGTKYNTKHIPYGMVYLPEGRLKSREGKIVDADNLINEIKKIAEKELLKREPNINKNDLEEKSNAIGMAAIRFYLLKIDTTKDMTYNPEESISFDGETGPYIQYTYARANSILNKEKQKGNPNYTLLVDKKEQELITHLSKLQQQIEEAAKHYKPSIFARYTIDLAQKFNEFYHACPVLNTNNELKKARFKLVQSSKEALEICMNLLQITPLKHM